VGEVDGWGMAPRLHSYQFLPSFQGNGEQGSSALINVSWARQVPWWLFLPTHSLGVLDKFCGLANPFEAYHPQFINPSTEM
jgi:hypothetical protein